MHSLILKKNYLPPPLKSIWICEMNCTQRSRSLWSGGLTAQTLTATICPNISLLSALIFQVKTGKGGCSFSLRISMCQADAHIKRSERWRHESEDDDVRKTTSTFTHTQRNDWYYLQGTSSSTFKCGTETHPSTITISTPQTHQHASSKFLRNERRDWCVAWRSTSEMEVIDTLISSFTLSPNWA